MNTESLQQSVGEVRHTVANVREILTDIFLLWIWSWHVKIMWTVLENLTATLCTKQAFGWCLYLLLLLLTVYLWLLCYVFRCSVFMFRTNFIQWQYKKQLWLRGELMFITWVIRKSIWSKLLLSCSRVPCRCIQTVKRGSKEDINRYQCAAFDSFSTECYWCGCSYLDLSFIIEWCIDTFVFVQKLMSFCNWDSHNNCWLIWV